MAKKPAAGASKTVQVNFRWTPRLKAAVVRAAKGEGRSLAGMVERALVYYLAEQPTKKGGA